MPALEVFGVKWKLGSDDLVFPYICSVMFRVVWFVSVGVLLLTYDKSYSCNDEHLLKIYLYILTGLHLVMAILEVSVVVLSASGTIAVPYPRRNIRFPLYILMVFFMLEVAWDIVGVVWAFDPSIDCHRSHTVLLVTRCILVWNFICSGSVGLYLILRIGICRIPCCCCCDPSKKMKYEHLTPTSTYGGHRLSRASSEALIHHRRQRVWQWRVQCFFCWLRLKGEQQTAFADMASTLADAFNHFRGYVPSDILAGIALYSLHHTNVVNFNEYVRKRLDFKNKLVSKHFNRAVHYMKFAAGAYGASAYLHHNGILCGCLKLGCSFCSCMCKNNQEQVKVQEEGFGVKQGVCGCGLKALKKTTGLEDVDIVFSSLKSEVFCPAFFVAVDHQYQAVVVSIRGTLSLYDILTDLSVEPEVVITTEEGDVWGHRGLLIAAHGVQLKMENELVLSKAFRAYSHYKLIIVGHSLGAGTAAILSIILKQTYPKLQCFAYAPPGCVIDMASVPYTRRFITTIILGTDIAPRMRSESLETLSTNILDLIQSCRIAKYQIFVDSFLYWLGCCKPCLLRKKRMLSTTELILDKDPNVITDFNAGYEEEDIYDVVADMKALRKNDRITGKERLSARPKLPLFIPGRIVHISWDEPIKKCCGLIKVEQLQAHWTAHSEFSDLVLDDNSFHHHLPYVILGNMLKLQKQLKTLKLEKEEMTLDFKENIYDTAQ